MLLTSLQLHCYTQIALAVLPSSRRVVLYLTTLNQTKESCTDRENMRFRSQQDARRNYTWMMQVHSSTAC
jgi:hypothetical protein